LDAQVKRLETTGKHTMALNKAFEEWRAGLTDYRKLALIEVQDMVVQSPIAPTQKALEALFCESYLTMVVQPSFLSQAEFRSLNERNGRDCAWQGLPGMRPRQ
jgi:hypothetical protein